MGNCKDCNKEIYCADPQYTDCVFYEGHIPEHSSLSGECSVSMTAVVEDLYKMYSAGGVQYSNGEGLNLFNYVFSVKYGTTEGTALEGNWRPLWEDITDKPEIPEPVNLISGNNVTITGDYPNYIINAEVPQSDITLISGANINIVENGGNSYTISALVPQYTAGNNITISPSNEISATYTPINHTGDVTGTQQLTISDGVVSNVKLANAPGGTIKGRQGSSGVVQDLTQEQAKEVIGAEQQTIVTLPSETTYSLQLNRKLTTGLFLSRETKDVTIPNGDFEGQVIFIGILVSGSPTLSGVFIPWNSGTLTPTTTYSVSSNSRLFWSDSYGAWIISE